MNIKILNSYSQFPVMHALTDVQLYVCHQIY